MDEAEAWRWIWLATAAAGFVGEILTAGSFFLLPFGVGAAAACFLAFAGAGVAAQWIAFVGVSLAGFAATRRLAARLDRSLSTEGIGSNRWVGQSGTVLAAIPPGVDEVGLVRIGREEWRAQTFDGSPAHAGAPVRVVEVRGTRLVVRPVPAAEEQP